MIAAPPTPATAARSILPSSGTNQNPPAESIRVLLLEDNPGDARLIELMLEDAGAGLFVLEHVERLQTALEHLSNGGYSIVLSDLSLPDSQGLQTFAQLHARAPQVPIIVLSGLNDTTLAVQAVHEGAQDFLVKGRVDGQLLARAMRDAIERKRMTEQLGQYARELHCKNAQLEADFNMAREVQEMFLPAQFPVFPANVAPEESALRFSRRYRPAASVGGDFFDVLPVSNTSAGLFICDVMGHGMRAALVTAIMRGLLEELSPVASEPGRFLAEMNRSLHAILRRTHHPFMATAFYAVADIDAHELRFANAGHPSPLLVRRSRSTVEPLKALDPRHGPALGLFSKAAYPGCAIPLLENDLLLLFTDGLYEAEHPHEGEFGQDRLRQAVKRAANLPAEQLLDRLIEEVQSFSGTSDFEDDVCLLGLEVRHFRLERAGALPPL